jgi:aminotransferase
MMDETGHPELSDIVKEQIKNPSPIRQIMKMAGRQNIINMGLDPDRVISFGGGWVNHPAPKEFREAYMEIASDEKLFHQTGGYTDTLGNDECREQIAEFEKTLFGMRNISMKNIIVGMGSTQLTHDMLRCVLNPGDRVMVLDPTYANYFGQIAFAVKNVTPVPLPVLDPKTWEYLPVTSPRKIIDDFDRLFREHKPKLVMFCAPDNPTSQIVPQDVVESMTDTVTKNGSYLAIDFAYKCQYFIPPPKYYSWSPEDYPNVIGIHSNSKWSRGLGRRLGWIEASGSIIDGMERVQQCSILCPDTLQQMAMARYLKKAIPGGSLRKYVDEWNKKYRETAKVTIDAIDSELGMPRTEPMGGLYTVVNVGMDGNEFTMNALKNTSVLVIPGRGFGSTLKNGVRISYGPMVTSPEKITEGLGRIGKWLKGRQ